MLDLVLKGGRVIDPASGLDRVADVGFRNGKVAEIHDGLEGAATQDVTGMIVTPGLIDLHTHVYWGATSLSVRADSYALGTAATTLVDAGSAGPGTFHGFRSYVVEPAETRILAYIHVSFAGIFAFSPTVMVGESQDIRLLAAREAVATARENPDIIIGVKVRVGRNTSGALGIAPLTVALQVAEEAGLPLMVHIDEPPPSYSEVVDTLRPGDVLTHCFRPFPNAAIDGDGNPRAALLRARERGVLFDVGHGMGAFSWHVARHMLAAGFPPDTISSDVHALCIDGPAFDLAHTMTKFLALGMPLAEVIAAATVTPARAIRRDDLGTLSPDVSGDASILNLAEGTVELEDVLGEKLSFDKRLEPLAVVRSGKYQAIQ